MKAAEVLLRELFGPPVVDVNTVQGKDLQQFTEQQIEDCCAKLDKMCLAFHSERTAMVMALQIIRQLQAVLKGPVCLNPEVAIGIRGE